MSGALEEIESQIAALESELAHERGTLLAQIEEVEAELHASHDHDHGHVDHGHDDHAGHDDHGDHHGMSAERMAMLEARLHELEHMLEGPDVVVLSNAAAEAKAGKVHRLKRHRQRIMEVKPFDYEGGREVEFVFRSRDVIHSAYMPHFRAQMNTVPGVPTRFKMTPTITTDSMRTVVNDPDFDYVLLCNKVCGAAHFNMQMKLVVESEESYKAWLESQEEFLADKEVATESDARAEAANIENNESATL